jgi:3-methylcrotonyl-CoA carboxylase beta subunit
MAGQGFDPNFTFSWPTARIGVMEGESAIGAIYGPELEKLKAAGQPVPPELDAKIAQTRADYERWLDARYAAARGHCDAIIDPAATRAILDFAFDVACTHEHTEHVPLELIGEGHGSPR